MPGPGYDVVRDLMDDFARRTGLDPVAASPRRYLWTDAFAVCNYLGLWQATGEDRWRELALRLVDQVHRVLGRHRPDDPRGGWISGLSEAEGERHPTVAGLRIGKPRPERGADEPYDARREWDRDGQYYHYLTKWMHALDRVWQATDDTTYVEWAVELAVGAQRAFTARATSDRHLWWKVSIDGSRPLVDSSGHHDPLDGLLTVQTLAVHASGVDPHLAGRLRTVVDDLVEMCRNRRWATDDPLGAGGLLVDAWRCSLIEDDCPALPGLAPRIANDAAASLEASARSGFWRQAADYRLAFRELGLSIGIRAADRTTARLEPPPPPPARPTRGPYDVLASTLIRHHSLADVIERFWLDPRHRRASTWQSHRDISTVMLATSLAPRGFLGS